MEENKKPENPSAFPNVEYSFYDGEPNVSDYSTGMTLRDYFAAKALQGWMANPMFVNNKQDQEYAAQAAYKVADLMLKEREK